MKPPSLADQQRAIAFLAESGTDNPRLAIYRVLLKSGEGLSAQEITKQLPFSTTANNTSSKLNHLRRCGLASVVKTKKSDVSGKRVDCWMANEDVPRVIEFKKPDSWYLAIGNPDVVVAVESTEEGSRKSMIEEFPGCRIVRVVEAD